MEFYPVSRYSFIHVFFLSLSLFTARVCVAMMMMISYIINEQRKEERCKVLVKRDEQKHEYILIYWGENLLSFLSLSEGRRTRREHDDERAYTHKTKQNKTNAPLNGGIFELSSNWWSFAFLIGTTNCCARRWTTTGRQT